MRDESDYFYNALPIEGRIELGRRIDIADSLIFEAKALAVREATVCAPRLSAAKRWGPISVLFLVGFGLIALFSYLIDKNGLSIFSLIVAVLAFQLSQLRQSRLESSREILFDRQWQDILSRWKAIGLSDPDITAIPIYIAEVHKLYGWKVPKADELTNGTGLANFRSQVRTKLIRHVESMVSTSDRSGA